MSKAAAPSQRYATGVARGDWLDDPAQHAALTALDRIHQALLVPRPTRGLFARWFDHAPSAGPQGLYLWGGVGRGKTFLIDLFFAGLPFAEKRRTHFHRFMRDIHERLRAHAGETGGDLGKAAARVTLVEADVRAVRKPRCDILMASNFSWWGLKTRAELGAYFRNCRRYYQQ